MISGWLSQRNIQIALFSAIFFLFLAVPLFQQLYISSAHRPASDDYCLLWKTDELSVSQFQESLLNNSSGRLTYLYSINMLYRLGPGIMTVLPASIWIIFVAAIALVLRSAQFQRKKKPLSWLNVAAMAGLTSSLTYVLTPNQFQNFYWSTGVLNYVLGFSALAGAFALTLNLYKQKKLSYKWTALLFIVSYSVALFNEPQTFFSIVIFAGLSVWGFARRWPLEQKILSVTTLAASIFGLATILSSDGARGRIDSSGGGSIDINNIGDSLSSSWDIYVSTLGALDWELIPFVLVFSFLFGFTQHKSLLSVMRGRLSVLLAAFIAFGTLYGAIFLNVFVSAADFVPQRSLFLGYALVSLALVYATLCIGVELGNSYKSLSSKFGEVSTIVTTIIIGVGLVFVLNSFQNHLEIQKNLSAQVVARGNLYDQRLNHIEENVPKDGTVYLTGLGTRGGVTDLKVQTPHWLNDCFADFNGLDEVRTRSEEKL